MKSEAHVANLKLGASDKTLDSRRHSHAELKHLNVHPANAFIHICVYIGQHTHTLTNT